MPNKPKVIDPIPDEFASYEAAAEFWDTHDTTDYLESFETVPATTEFKSRRYEIEIDADLMPALYKRALSRHVKVGNLVNDLLREKMRPAT